jgi:isoquinoline 1-oxidoreductase beta subunit
MTDTLAVSRRGFLAGSAATAAAAGGFTFGFHVPRAEAATTPGAPEINAWVVVRPDETVVIRIARIDMGQGTLTGLAQLVAEELECDWARVTTEYPTPGQNLARNRVWGNFQTAGSQGIRQSQEYVRKGGAAARMMLVEAAAREWGVPAASCTVSKGVITHAASGRSTTYGKMADAAAKITPPTDVPLKDPSTWTLAGKPLPRLDTVDKTNGKKVFGIDVTMPGMLNAAIRDCPVLGGKVKSFDAAAVTGMKGVKKVVKVGETGVAVIADTWWRAKTALDALPVEWDLGANAAISHQQVVAMLKEGLEAKEAFVGNQAGDADGAIAGAARKVEATYHFPHQHHVTLEPQTATAKWTADRCEVWCPTQNGEAALATAAAAAGIPVQQCEVYRIDPGGGFGRRATSHDYVRQAVLIAKEMPGTPVKLIWSREEDMLHGWLHPITMAKMSAGLDANGNVVGFRMRISGQSILAGVNPAGLQNGRDPILFQGLNPSGTEGTFGYDIPNVLVDHAMRNPPVNPGFWRGVCNNQNAYYLECFMDEVAQAAGQDTYQFRRKMLLGKSPKHLAVLDAVADGIGWSRPAPAGVFRGIAQHMGYGSYVAAAAEVSVNAAGVLKIHRIVAATDCGHAVNPQQIAAQVEGSFAYGLSAFLYGEMTLAAGKVEQENLDTYQIIRMDEFPAVETRVVTSGGFWGGVGEPTIFVAAPAVANAIFAATGKRVRDLPLKHNDLRRA